MCLVQGGPGHILEDVWSGAYEHELWRTLAGYGKPNEYKENTNDRITNRENCSDIH